MGVSSVVVSYVDRFDFYFGAVYTMNVHAILSSVKVIEEPPFREKLLPRLAICSLCIMYICCLSY